VLYLELIWLFFEILYGRKALLKQIELASFVFNMIYLGTKCIRNAKFKHILQSNWLTHESILVV
jgi:phenylalanine-4-hydroxylase